MCFYLKEHLVSYSPWGEAKTTAAGAEIIAPVLERATTQSPGQGARDATMRAAQAMVESPAFEWDSSFSVYMLLGQSP